jgi:lipopolysaccharide export system protein LptA
MKHLSAITACWLAMVPAYVHALSSDSEQPIEIEADFAELDETEGRTIYRGNVIVVQGSIRMTGDLLRVNLDDQNELQDAYLEGQPAVFKQRPDNSENDIVGRALTIEYHSKENLLYLIREARVTRGEELFEGHRISYDTERSIITAHAEETADAGQGRRVRIVIPPQKKDEPTE